MDIRMTRRQFGLSLLAAIGSLFLWRFFGRGGSMGAQGDVRKRARYWRSSARLAG